MCIDDGLSGPLRGIGFSEGFTCYALAAKCYVAFAIQKLRNQVEKSWK